ncbi:hypothetical protein JCM17845_15350 [Iodidimonas gelatinilytica]|uniref:GapR-like DNA-binding domain-containing protein n=1 Tax=Iodidimonas gelatinilytica TaxID=1236966 RepID=A0A5A7MY46_9PROT|nr:GapR family DNA-binding domain-containing protein [Iodidimonas gelatinilytica]GER00912.1 hypothetical protein JCM17845_15350 [Iodidimonas gelatinilytica]
MMGVEEEKAPDLMRRFLARLENIAKAREAINVDARELDAEIKAMGFEPKILRAVLKRMLADPQVLEESEALLAVYAASAGQAPPPDAETAADRVSALAAAALDLHSRAQREGAVLALKKSRAWREQALAQAAADAGAGSPAIPGRSVH